MADATNEATYPLDEIRQLCQQKHWTVTQSASDDALALGFDEEDIIDCIVNALAETHFYKTMPSEKRPELMQDVYRITYQGQRIYLKLQIVSGWANIVSFKEE